MHFVFYCKTDSCFYFKQSSRVFRFSLYHLGPFLVCKSELHFLLRFLGGFGNRGGFDHRGGFGGGRGGFDGPGRGGFDGGRGGFDGPGRGGFDGGRGGFDGGRGGFDGPGRGGFDGPGRGGFDGGRGKLMISFTVLNVPFILLI